MTERATNFPRAWWPMLKRLLTIGFIALVATLLVIQLREVDWSEVQASIATYSMVTLLFAFVSAAGSHLLYGLFDQIGRIYTGHTLPRLRVAQIAFVSYAFNLNMGAMVGGVGFRYRLYARYGLDAATITKIMSLSIGANWIGYSAVAGVIFASGSLTLPSQWEVGTVGLRLIGGGLMAAVLVYLAACGLSPRRSWTVRGHVIDLPSLRMAMLQTMIAAANWMLIGALVWILLRQQVPYPTVLAVFLISAIAGVLAHVPAGLGVIELVFITLLEHMMPRSELIAALVAFRVVYYLVPLLVAVPTYLWLEAQARNSEAR